MATISSHVLDSLHGSHAAGIRCVLQRIDGDVRVPVFDVVADHEGRIQQDIELVADGGADEFELVLHAADYFACKGVDAAGSMRVVVLRFIVDRERRYHLPVMLAPHSYSTWWSD